MAAEFTKTPTTRLRRETLSASCDDVNATCMLVYQMLVEWTWGGDRVRKDDEKKIHVCVYTQSASLVSIQFNSVDTLCTVRVKSPQNKS